MPVSQILCEGAENSPDIRVLAKLLNGIAEIKALGGKYGMGERIIARREILGSKSVFGILDGDFLKDWKPPTGRPKTWTTSDGYQHLGWRWERVEIENYLLDPEVVAKALGNRALANARYEAALENARDMVAIYQAARISLSASRVRFKDIPSRFGIERGKEKHLFPVAFDQESCVNSIREIVATHQITQQIAPEQVIASFFNYIPECTVRGVRYKQYLTCFAGKDLLCALDQWSSENGFSNAWVFREKILSGIQRTTEDIAQWLPEWNYLKQTISKI